MGERFSFGPQLPSVHTAMAPLHLPTPVSERGLASPPASVWPDLDSNLCLCGLLSSLPCCLQTSVKRSKREMLRGQGEKERRKSLENSKDRIPTSPQSSPLCLKLRGVVRVRMRKTERKLGGQAGRNLSLTSSFLT